MVVRAKEGENQTEITVMVEFRKIAVIMHKSGSIKSYHSISASIFFCLVGLLKSSDHMILTNLGTPGFKNFLKSKLMYHTTHILLHYSVYEPTGQKKKKKFIKRRRFIRRVKQHQGFLYKKLVSYVFHKLRLQTMLNQLFSFFLFSYKS